MILGLLVVALLNFWVNQCIAAQFHLDKFRCYDGFCKNVACQIITNCTKGRIVPKSSYCNCCDICIQYLEKNEACKEPLIGSLQDTKEPKCKEGFKCIDGKCTQASDSIHPCLHRRETMKAKRGTEKYADDLWIPDCDEEGNFQGKQLKKRSAICVDKQGNKMFGEAQPEFSKNMTCGCSRYLEKLQKENVFSFNAYPQGRCSASGDFERIQCLRDLCYCADPVTGEVEGRIVKTAYVNKLPCYNKEIHGKFLKACEKELKRTRALRYHFHLKGLEVYGLEEFQCDFDGTFSSVQCDSINCLCTDKNGATIRSFYVGNEEYEQLKTRMTCNCARDIVSSHSQYPKLNCKGYGDFSHSQCFSKSQCFCVDTDGDVISRMLNKTEADEDFCKDILLRLTSSELITTTSTSTTEDDSNNSDYPDYSD